MVASVAIHVLVLAALMTEPKSGRESAEQFISVTEMVTIEALPQPAMAKPANEEEKTLTRPGRQQTASKIIMQPAQSLAKAGKPQNPAAISHKAKQISASAVARSPALSQPIAPLSVEEKLKSELPPVRVATTAARADRQTGGSKESARKLVRKHLEAFKFYPASARRRGIEGHVDVGFTLAQNGAATGVTVLQGSGHSVLDQAAMKTVYRAQPFPVSAGEFRFRLRFRRL